MRVTSGLLLTTTSRPPKAASANSTRRLTSVSFATSPPQNRAARPDPDKLTEDKPVEVPNDYAKVREQYGAPIGSYQAVGHLLAEGLALIEGSISVLRHAAWAVDELPGPQAVEAARVAKIYCARAALTVCETSIQVHGGIGNTWECLAHVYLRRVLAATEAWPVKLKELTIGLS